MSQRRLPAEIYWRRRLLMLAVLFLLVWLAIHLMSGGGGGKPSTTPTATVTTPTTAPTTVAPVDGLVNVSLVTATRACNPENIRITPTVDPGQFTNTAVTIGLVISSTETTACTLMPADAALVAVISANKTPIWDSTVCKTSLLTAPVPISPQWASLVDTTWSGRGSGGTCAKKEGYATPGTYVVQVGTLGGEPGKATFALVSAPKPKATPTPTDTPTPKKSKSTAKPKG